MKSNEIVKLLPSEMWSEIFKYTDIKSLSNLICTNTFFKNMIYNQFWYTIDNIIKHNIKSIDGLIPATIQTFNKYIYLVDWSTIVLHNQNNNKKIPESTIVWISNNIDLQIISTYQKFSDDLIRQIYHKISYKTLLSSQSIPDDILNILIEKNIFTHQDWYNVWEKHPIDYNFLISNIDNVQWHPLSSNKNIVCYEIIQNYGENIIWQEFTKHSINESILQLFTHKFDFICWSNIVRFTELSDKFIKNNLKHLDVGSLIRYQSLSKDLLNDIVSKFTETDFFFYFISILSYQEISKDFLLKYFNIEPRQTMLRALVKNKKVPRSLLHELYPSKN